MNENQIGSLDITKMQSSTMKLTEGINSLRLNGPQEASTPTNKTKKRNRRKSKKDKSDDPKSPSKKVEALALQFDPVKASGLVLRKRDRAGGKINLQPFTKENKPYIFTTKSDVCKLNDTVVSEAGCVEQTPVKNDKSKEKNKKKGKTLKTPKTPPEPPRQFEEYMTIEDVNKGLADGTLFKGQLRINPKFFTDAYVSQDDKKLEDYFINSIVDRNRALEGDTVVLKTIENEGSDKQSPAKVVYIWERVHSRISVGHLAVFREKGKRIAKFTPRDRRIPHMNITNMSLPQGYFKNPHKYDTTLFLVQMINWEHPKYADGTILENIGKADELLNETKAILLENQIDFRPYPPQLLRYVPRIAQIPETEIESRLDLRKDCIFTIDPLTAKDLDDAMSCKQLENGNFEIGVHIADVAHFLTEGTPLDELVSKRATSTYLIDNVYHMLPPEMCMMCSLLPGSDKLTFSVIWEMTPSAEIITTRFSRTIINSCTQLAYEHAQKVIEHPNKNFDTQEFPFVHNFELEQICGCIRDMQMLASQMRKRRIENGALRIDQIKLGFGLDGAGSPDYFYKQENKEANHMIEEFMLLANISVAERIYHDFETLAFLRRHDPPKHRLLAKVKETLETVGIHINIDSSGLLHDSLLKYNNNDGLGLALNHLLAKPMQRAVYFCTNDEDPNTFNHFALSIPIYTHFTSPIRRYADIMVHRLLSASLGYTDKPNWRVDYVQDIANNCNKRKYNAKKAGDASCELYLLYFIDKHQPFITDAVVVAVFERAFDAITIDTGTLIRIYTNNFEEDIKCSTEQYGTEEDKKMWKMVVVYPKTKELAAVTQVIEIFQIVKVSLKRRHKTSKLEAALVRPSHIKALPINR